MVSATARLATIDFKKDSTGAFYSRNVGADHLKFSRAVKKGAKDSWHILPEEMQQFEPVT